MAGTMDKNDGKYKNNYTLTKEERKNGWKSSSETNTVGYGFVPNLPIFTMTYNNADSKTTTTQIEKDKKFKNISQDSLYKDAKDLVNAAVAKGYKDLELYGLSMGGAPVTEALRYIAEQKKTRNPLFNDINVRSLVLDTSIPGTHHAASLVLKHKLKHIPVTGWFFDKLGLANHYGDMMGEETYNQGWHLDPVENIEAAIKAWPKFANIPVLYITGDDNDFFTATETNVAERLIKAGCTNIKTIVLKDVEHSFNKHPYQYLNVNMNDHGKTTFKTREQLEDAYKKDSNSVNMDYQIYKPGTSWKNRN